MVKNRNFIIFIYLSAQFNHVEGIHTALRQVSGSLSSCTTEILCPPCASPLISPAPVPGSHHSALFLWDWWFWTPHTNVIPRFVLQWLAHSPGVMCSSFIRVVACDLTPSSLRLIFHCWKIPAYSLDSQKGYLTSSGVLCYDWWSSQGDEIVHRTAVIVKLYQKDWSLNAVYFLMKTSQPQSLSMMPGPW